MCIESEEPNSVPPAINMVKREDIHALLLIRVQDKRIWLCFVAYLCFLNFIRMWHELNITCWELLELQLTNEEQDFHICGREGERGMIAMNKNVVVTVMRWTKESHVKAVTEMWLWGIWKAWDEIWIRWINTEIFAGIN